MTKNIRIILVFALLLGCSVSAAQEPQRPKQEQLTELLDLMGIDRAHELGRKSCIDTALNAPFSPSKALAKDGKYFGFTEQSPAWPAVLQAFDRYAITHCSSMSLAEMRSRYADFYGARVSEEDLDRMIAFMRTPAGRTFVVLQDEFIRVVGGEIQRRAAVAASDAQAAFSRDLQGLASRK